MSFMRLQNIDKTIMVSNISNSINKINNSENYKNKLKLKKYWNFRKFIEKNFENVGDNFIIKLDLYIMMVKMIKRNI